MNNTYYKILNEIASVFDMDQWDEQVNLFTNVIKEQLNPFIHHTETDYIYILEGYAAHDFPQFDFYKERCYVNGEKVELDNHGRINNKWKDRETVNVTIEDLDQLGESCKFMFAGCKSLVSVPWFNTSRVTNMREMFFKCEALKSVPKFDTSSVTDMNCMFICCFSLESVPKFDTSKVTSMRSMFSGCKSLVYAPEFDTGRVTNMNSMFYECESLESVSKFDISSVTNMNYMFYRCSSVSEETKQAWSSVYNFKTHIKK